MFEIVSKSFQSDFTISLGQQWYSYFLSCLSVCICIFLCIWTSESREAEPMFLCSQKAFWKCTHFQYVQSQALLYIFPIKLVMFHVVYNETWMPCRTGNAKRIREIAALYVHWSLPCTVSFEVWALKLKHLTVEERPTCWNLLLLLAKKFEAIA